MRSDFRERVRWRLRHHSLAMLLRIAGRPVYCANCGRELFRALPSVRHGRLKLLGARESNVRVAFEDKDVLRFWHLELDQCPCPERPWLR